MTKQGWRFIVEDVMNGDQREKLLRNVLRWRRRFVAFFVNGRVSLVRRTVLRDRLRALRGK